MYIHVHLSCALLNKAAYAQLHTTIAFLMVNGTCTCSFIANYLTTGHTASIKRTVDQWNLTLKFRIKKLHCFGSEKNFDSYCSIDHVEKTCTCSFKILTCEIQRKPTTNGWVLMKVHVHVYTCTCIYMMYNTSSNYSSLNSFTKASVLAGTCTCTCIHVRTVITCTLYMCMYMYVYSTCTLYVCIVAGTCKMHEHWITSS